MKIHSKQGNQPNPHIVWHQKCEISIKIPLMTAKKCKISSSSSPNLEKNWNLGSGPNVVLSLELFTYYVSNVYVPRVRANADQVLTTPPRVSRDPKKCWRNMWMAPKVVSKTYCYVTASELSVTPEPDKIWPHSNSGSPWSRPQVPSGQCPRPGANVADVCHSRGRNSIPVLSQQIRHTFCFNSGFLTNNSWAESRPESGNKTVGIIFQRK